MPRIAIIGGGLAGLAAAETLSRMDNHSEVEVSLFEAKRLTGGRAGSFLDGQGDSVDYCQHVAMGCCIHFLDFIRQLGLENHFRRFDELTFLHRNGTRSRFRASAMLPAPFHLTGSLLGLKYLSIRQKWQIGRAVLAMMRTPPAALGDVTADRWLKQHGQDPSTIREFWDVVLVSALGELTEHVSARAARKVFIDGFAIHRSASDVWVPQRPLADLFGEGAVKPLGERGVRVNSSSPIQQIRAQPHDGCVSKFSLCTSNRTSHEADAVILAIPWHALTKVQWNDGKQLPLENLERIHTIPASPITGVHLWFDRPITELPHAVLVGTTSQWLFRDPILHQEATGTAKQDPSQTSLKRNYYQVVISASPDGRQQSKSELLDVVLGELAHFFPEVHHAHLIQSRIVTDPKSVFSIRPEVDAIRPPTKTDVPGLFLAGDWVQTQWPATMEGAVRSGRLAAVEAASSLGLEPPKMEWEGPTGWLASRLIQNG